MGEKPALDDHLIQDHILNSGKKDRSDGVIFDAAESTDNIENQKFAEWDYSV